MKFEIDMSDGQFSLYEPSDGPTIIEPSDYLGHLLLAWEDAEYKSAAEKTLSTMIVDRLAPEGLPSAVVTAITKYVSRH